MLRSVFEEKNVKAFHKGTRGLMNREFGNGRVDRGSIIGRVISNT